MRTKPFGPTGEPVGVIGQGTWQVRDPKACKAALLEGIRLGMTHIDTAELYERGSGSETMLGELLAQPALPGLPAARPGGGAATLGDQVFLASKVLPRNASAKGVVSACKDSMVRLGVGQLDLYYHHWREGGVPLGETLRAIAGLVDAGWVRHIGVSNYDVDDLDEALAILGPGRIAANQVLYHLEDSGAESEAIPWCRSHRVAVVAYSPFGAGAWVSGARRRRLEEVAAEAGLTPRQACLAFLTREPHVFAIPKAERAEHVRDNAGGGAVLPKDAVAALDEAFPVAPGLRTI